MSASTTAIVTGAGRGIGEAIVAKLASDGMDVIGVDRVGPPPASPARSWVIGDVAEDSTWAETIERSRELPAHPSVIVANAAIVTVGTLLDLTDDDWLRTLNVNLLGAIKAVRTFLPGMLEEKRGSVVTVGSVDAYMAEQGVMAYCASKGALLQFTRVLALDHARDGIRANCVCPGVTDTPLFRGHLSHASDPDRFLLARVERNPLGRLLDPSEVANVVAFLASDDSGGITGATITVDAGLSTGFDFRTGAEGA